MGKGKELKFSYDVILHPTAPFNFNGTVHKPSHFPSSDNLYKEGIYWQTMRFDGMELGTKLTDLGSVNNPCVQLSIYADKEISSGAIDRISKEIEFRFDLSSDISDFIARFNDDEILGPVLDRWKGMRVMVNVSLYEFLIIATVLQNATVRRSVQMLENLFEHYGSTVKYNDVMLSVYWPPKVMAKASEHDLRELKVGYRAKHLLRQASPFVVGEFDEFELRRLPSDELKKILLSIYGIGPASVGYLMFEVFKRYDVLDYISPWEQKIYSRLLFNKESVDVNKILSEITERWGKWKMLAIHYVFEDLFWQRKNEEIPWLEELIRL